MWVRRGRRSVIAVLRCAAVDDAADPRTALRAFARRTRDRILGPNVAPVLTELTAQVDELAHQLDEIRRAQTVASSEREVMVEQLGLVSARVETVLEELRHRGATGAG